MTDVDVVVVGAGIAGLSAARALAAEGRSVAVLEARDRVAGRTTGEVLDNGEPIEMGGQWVGPTQDAVLELIEELGLKLRPGYAEGDRVIAHGDKVVRASSVATALSGESGEVFLKLWAELDELAQTVSLSSPWLTESAAELDKQTVHSWVRSKTDDAVALGLWDTLVPALVCAEASEVSLLHYLFYIKSGTNLQVLHSGLGGAQESRVVGGTHQISERMAAQLGDAVRLSTPVHTIEQDDDGVCVRFDGGESTARRAIVTLPPTLAGRLRYSPPLPSARDQLTQQVPMGSVIKIQLVYDTPFWQEDGLSGVGFSLDDAVSATANNSPVDGSCGILVGFFEGANARRAATLTVEERKRLAVDTMVKFFGPRAKDPVQYLEKDWMAEEYSRGCYGGRLGAGVWTQYGEALAEPCGRIHWAGTETSDVWNGYMDGAVRSGRRAAAEVLVALG